MFLQIVFGDELKTLNVAFLALVFYNLLNPNLNSKPNPNFNPKPKYFWFESSKGFQLPPTICTKP